ncbi:MAG: TonB-dependent receptor [Chitinophagaceae bacterium]|nr:TonB-dependent receptor [Chitinophagaceae bacterium]
MRTISITVFIFFLFFNSTTAIAQGNAFAEPGKKFITGIKGTFSGRVTDASTGAAIAGATVYISDIRSGTASDAAGHFKISNIPPGIHLVEISHIGYSSIVENIDISTDVTKDYALSESIIENNAVVVTGVTGATQLKKVPFAVSVLRREDFFRNTSSNIIESLTKISGVSTLATGPAISKPVIRGLSYNRVLTINDGVRQEGQQWGDEHGIEIDEASVHKIELLKGPASIIYGSDAMAGVVNIITNVPVPVNTIKANLSSNYQTNNHLSTINLNMGGNKNGFNWNLYTSNKAAGDYKNKYDGRVFNSKFTENNIGGYAGYNGKWGFSHLIISNFNLKAGLIEGERDGDGFFIKNLAGGITQRANNQDFKTSTPFIPYQHIRHFKIATDNNIKLGKNQLTFNIGYQQNQREEFGNPDNTGERALFFNLKTITYTAQYRLAEMKGWKTSFGINGMQQKNTNKGEEQLIPDYSLFDLGVYAFTQKTIKHITLSGGVRFDNRNVHASALLDGSAIKGNAFKRSFSNFSGSIGMAAQVTDAVNLKFNIARGFRAPSIPEMASNGAHEGTIRYEYGNTRLKSETSLQLDAGIDYNTEHISVGLSAFYNSFDNFIFYRKLQSAMGSDSIVNYNGEDLTAFQFDQTKAALTGLEATVDIHPHPLDWLHILNTFSVVSGQLRNPVEGNTYLPFIPASKLVTEFKGSFNRLTKQVQNFYIKFEVDNTFSKKNVFSAYNTETVTTGYTLLNAGIGTDFVNKKDQTIFSLGFSALNIGDVAYQNHLSRLKYAEENQATGRMGVFNMGRNFSIKLNIPLTVNLNK